MNHSGHTNEPKSSGSDMCMVENRDSENHSQLDRSVIANHVWETCKPGSNFMVKTPTVSARRVQLMRAQLQSDKVRECEKDPAAEQAAQQAKCNKIPPPSNTCHCGAKMNNNNNNGSSNPKTKDCNSESSSSLSDAEFACEDENCAEENQDDECEYDEFEDEEEDDCNY